MPIRAISYGGGVQSTALLVLAAQRVIDFPLALFSNVGDDSEHPATLAYYHTHAVPYAARHGIELVELTKQPKGQPRTLYGVLTNPDSRSIGIPARLGGSGQPARRSCTVDFKIKRVIGELKRRGATATDPATTALGISIDEYHRMRTDSGIPQQLLTYPLIDLRLSRDDCKALIETAGLPVPPKSSCYFCPFHSLTTWRAMRTNEPDLFAKSVALEAQLSERHQRLPDKHGNSRGPIFFTDTQRPLTDATEPTGQLDLFPETDASCDIGGYCHS